MRRIVKIQAVFRGILTRRYVKQVYGFQVQSNDLNLVAYYQQPNYDNQLVQSIRDQLGDFNYQPYT